MPLYALGWGRWVELREARKAPLAECSEVEHPIDPRAFRPWERPKPFIRIKQMCFRGGTYICTLPRRRFAAITRLTCGLGDVIGVPPLLAERLRKVYHEYAPSQAAQAAA